MSLVKRKPDFAYAKTKMQISFAVIAKLISAFVFATRIVQSLFFQNPKFQASRHLLWLYSPVCVGPGRKPRRPVFSQRGPNRGSRGSELHGRVSIMIKNLPCSFLFVTSQCFGIYQCSTMLERQNSSKTAAHKHNHNLGHVKPALLQRQKTRSSLLQRRPSSSFLLKHTAVTSRNNPNLNNKVRQLLEKNAKFGFILNIVNNNQRLQSLTDNHSGSASEELYNNNYLPSAATEHPDHELADLLADKDIAAKIINKEEFTLGQVLGRGGFGSVYLGTFKGETVAVKIMHKFTRNPAAQLESFKSELHVLKFKHPNIIQTLAATHIDEFEQGAWVVMEYVSDTSLQKLIDDPSESLDPDRRLKYSLQIASALAYAHKQNVAHLDLKPANILISTGDDCKVGDFGCSQQCEFETGIVSPTNRSVLTGTYAYRAPELLRGEAPTFRADVYSFGITLWQMRSRERPYGNMNHQIVLYQVAKGLRPENPDPTDTDPFELSYKDLYEQCWVACPLDRPSTQELVDLLTIWKEHH